MKNGKAANDTLPQPKTYRLILALVMPLSAWLLQGLFWSTIQPFVWFFFYPAVFLSSWLDGRRGGLAATALSTVIVWWYFIPPRYSFAVERPGYAFTLLIFVGMGILFSLTHERLRKASEETTAALAAATAARDQLEQRVEERTADLAQTVDALRDSEQEFRLLAESMPQIVWVTRPDGWNIYFNRQWVDYTGLSLEESYGNGWNIPFHPDDRQRAWDAWQNATATAGAYALECRLRRWDGAYCWWLVRGVPVRDAEGKILKWFGTCTDIEELKRSEEELQNSKAKLEAALESMTDAVFISDTEGRFIEFNNAFATFHKFRSKDECATTLAEYPTFLEVYLDTGELVPLDQWAVPRALRGEIVTNSEYSLRLKATGETWVGSYSFAPIRNQAGEVVGSVVTGRDITDKKKAESELAAHRTNLEQLVATRTAELAEARDRAEAATRAKSEFLANMSHELRTPLGTILGCAEILRDELRGPLLPEQNKFLTKIEESGSHLLSLINDILDLAKIEADRLEVYLEPVSVEMVCDASLQFIKELALKKRLSVSHSLEAIPTFMETDQRRLKQILVNLLSNAVKFTPLGGSVGLEVVRCSDNSALRFTVWDTGIGITAEDQACLFTPFVQIDSSLSRQHDGTGLGLALVARLVKLLGGAIALESRPGEGSRFTVTLPCRECPATLPENHCEEVAVSVVSLSGGQPLVLVVDDSLTNNEMISDYLEHQGFRTMVALTGGESVAVAREHHPALILMDVQLPEMDGLEAIRQIRAFPLPDNTVPIIALTALAMPGDRERGLEAGADEYLTKPVRLIDLVRCINILLTNSSHRMLENASRTNC